MIAWTVYLTFGCAVLLLFLPRVLTRWIALATAAAGFAIALVELCRAVDVGSFKTIVRIPWIPSLGMEYHLAVDGISLTLVLVTGLTAVSAVLFSWDVTNRPNEFFFWLLLVVAGSYGVFLSADLFLLFVFYELVIVPKYFLIAIWGSTNREYGAMKLTLYSFFGGALVFIGVLAVYVAAGTLDLQQLAQFQFAPALQAWAFPVLFLGFAVLAGIWPLHTWAPTGHVAAPTAGSMLLAGIVMKLGAYGALRVAMNLFPSGFAMWRNWIAVLAVIGIVYAAAVALSSTRPQIRHRLLQCESHGFCFAWPGRGERARSRWRGPANVLSRDHRGPAFRRRRTDDLSPDAYARSRAALSDEITSRDAVRGRCLRYRLGRFDGHSWFQWFCR